MFNRVPKWVRELPDDLMTKELLIQISRSSRKPLETPREINFDIKDFKNRSDAEEAAKKINDKGWQVYITKDSQNANLFWVSGRKDNYAISKEVIFEDEAFFDRIASLYQANYDGWYAKVVR